MQHNRTYRQLFLVFAMLPFVLNAQEIDYDSLLQRIDTVENPVYMPVVSFSYGVLNFRGDVRNSMLSPVIGNNAVSLNIATFVDRKHHFTGNFSYLLGNLSGNSYSYGDLSRNLNFRSSVSSIGANVEYRFGHMIKKKALLRPYVSVGVGVLTFSAKGDLTDAGGHTYYYWSDGSIMDSPESLPEGALPLYRDFEYETDLRLLEQEEFGLGAYSQKALVLPIGLGSHFRISSRAFFSLGISYHYAMTDMLDNVAFEGTSIAGRKGNDSFVFSHLSLHFDLFSDPSTRTVELLYADVEFDPLLFDDEDGDFVLDVTDRCPGSPYGVEVDSLGCPLDGDMDGVADYLDRELSTQPGAWVDEEGITVTDEDYLTVMEPWDNAMPREDVDAYTTIISGQYRLDSQLEIPENFQMLDTDGDGELSFEELLQVIDQFFDYQLDLEEVRKLNDFFFSQ
ncbi:MAG: EF-hand domain-containing protein [Bacteroidales bacterium]|nr:EF-hand domain-containing protein [Bacteroidales bacterium]